MSILQTTIGPARNVDVVIPLADLVVPPGHRDIPHLRICLHAAQRCSPVIGRLIIISIDQACGMIAVDSLSVVRVYQDIVYHCGEDGEQEHRCNLEPGLVHPCIYALISGVMERETKPGDRPELTTEYRFLIAKAIRCQHNAFQNKFLSESEI